MAILSRLTKRLALVRAQYLCWPTKPSRSPRRRIPLAFEELEPRNLLSGFAVNITGVPTLHTGPEGTAIALGSSLTNTSPGDTFTYAWNVSLKTGTSYASGTGTGLTFTPNDNGSYSVSLTVTDAAGLTAKSVQVLSIYDVAPTVTVPNSYTGLALSPLTFTGVSATDPSSVDTAAGFRFTWYFSDGTSGSGITPTLAFAKPGTYSVRVTAFDKDGLAGTAMSTVTITGPALTTTLTAPAKVPAGSTDATVSFLSVTGGTGGYKYSFDFGNTGTFEIAGSSSPIAIIPESYVDSGPARLTIRGRVTDSHGDYRDFTTHLKITDVAPTPVIVLPSPLLAKTPLTFSDPATDASHADTAAGFKYSWTFGDGTPAVSGETVTHTYAKNGTYTVTVTVTDKHGASASQKEKITVGGAAASFSGPSSVNEGATNAQVTFTNPAGGSGAYTYSYDFGATGTFEIAGTTATTENIPESYVDDGPATLIIRGRITDSLGDYTDYTTSITVKDVPPTPSITAPPSTDPGLAAAFQASATDPSTADTSAGFTYSWTFGDGTGKVTGANPSHAFTAPGTYTVTLTATDKDGGVGTTTTQFKVLSAPSATFSGPSSVSEGTTNAQVTFTNPTGGSGGYTFSYDFGNTGTFEITGSSNTSAAVPESYVDDAGTLVVRGRITDSKGIYTDHTTTIDVTDVAPTPSITPPKTIDSGVAVSFAGSATSPSTADMNAGFTYQWTFGDGTTPVTGANPSHTFAASGTYTVTLTATDADGGTVSGKTSVSVTVTSPSATFSGPATVTAGTTTAQVAFTNPAGGSGSYTYSYDFGDTGTFEITGSSSATATIPESYVDAPGTLVVHGRITDSLGGIADYTRSITVADVAPTPSITLSAPAETAVADTFIASATDPSTADTNAGFTYTWNFGDGTAKVTGPDPSHTYATAGTYTVTLTATDKYGAVGTTTDSLTVANSDIIVIDNSGPGFTKGGTGWAGEGYATAWGGNTAYNAEAPVGAATATWQTNQVQAGTQYLVQVSQPGWGPQFPDCSAAEYKIYDGSTLVATVTLDQKDAPVGPVYDGVTFQTLTTLVPTTDSITVTVTNERAGTLIANAIRIAPPGETPPSATLNGPGAVTAGTSNATVSFSNQTGGTAPYTYSYDFGNTGTFQIANSSNPAATIPESYLATPNTTLVVRGRIIDSDGNYTDYTTNVTIGAQGWIVTPYLNIPDFGANANIVSVQSGNWSNPVTWSLGRIPQAGDIVNINANTAVTYDVDDTTDAAPLNTVEIENGGTLTFSTTTSTQMNVVNLVVLQGGTLDIGTQAEPIPANITATVMWVNQPLDTTTDPAQYGNGLIALGTVNTYGAAKVPYVTLAQNAYAGNTTLQLASSATGWQIGDKLELPDTRELDYNSEQASNHFQLEWESMTIQTISANGLTITLAAPLQYNHLGATNTSGVLEYLPQVANMTRNVSIHSQSATGTRGYALFTDRANVNINYTSVVGMGRTTDTTFMNSNYTQLFDNTTFDSSGNVTHVGTNEENRNAITFLDLIGPTSPQANGYQSTFNGNVVTCPLNPMPFIWGINVVNSYYGLVQNNDVVNWAGSGVEVDGRSSYNSFHGNFVMRINGTGQRGSGDQGLAGDGFWFGNPNNYVTNDIVSDLSTNGVAGPYGYAFEFYGIGGASEIGEGYVTIPAYQGADPSQPGQSVSVDMNLTALLAFSGNEVYGSTPIGLSYWWLNYDPTHSSLPALASGGIVNNLIVWNVWEVGIYSYQSTNITINGFVDIGNAAEMAAGDGAVGFEFQDYFNGNLTVDNATVENQATGIDLPDFTSGTTTFENSYFANAIDVYVEGLWSVSANATVIGPRDTVFNNCQFVAPVADQAFTAIDMGWFDANQLQTGPANLIQSDQVFVYNYNGVSGDNFQVFYTQQAASFVVPQTIYNSDGTPLILGAPVAGLTNAQAWAEYGIAIAGAVAPSDATTMNSITGLVAPI